MDLFGGSIEVESHENEGRGPSGTTVHLNLPKAGADVATAA